MQIKNSIALVTGANRGLGKAYVKALLAAGAAKVYAGARNVDDISETDERVVAIKLDVTSQADVDAAAAKCTDLTVLINNAGIMSETKLLESDDSAGGILRIDHRNAP